MKLNITMSASDLTRIFGIPAQVAEELKTKEITAHRVSFDSKRISLVGYEYHLMLCDGIQDAATLIDADALPWL